MMARPTAASAAATAITKKTKTCPPMPKVCASATKVRFTALSMSSTHMKITITLRRNSTPATPSVKSTAEIASAGLRSILEPSLREHDGADDGGKEQHARDLEGNEVGAKQRIGDGADDALLLLERRDATRGQCDRRRQRRPGQGLQQKQQRGAEQYRDAEPERSFDIAGTGSSQVEQHDDEQEQHHDRAGVHQDLQHRQELRVEQHEQRRDGKEGDDKPERAGDGILARDAEQRAQHREDTESPEDRGGHYSPLGSDGSHSVETGCVCAVSRSRSYTKRSREYSEFS